MSWTAEQMKAAQAVQMNGHKPDAEFQVDVPPEMTQGMTASGSIAPRISRQQALQVPAVIRGRNLIAGTLASLPIHVRDKTNHIVSPTTLFDQIDPDIPNVVTLALTYEDLLFEGVSWWRVAEFGWHGFPTYARHIDHRRIQITSWIEPVEGQPGYQQLWTPRVYIDGYPVADNEVIRFDSPNPPLLIHAARAIRSALELDKTASNYATENLPLGYFTPKEGVRFNEDDTHVTGFLDKWAVSRMRRVYAFVPGQLELKALQFNAEQIQLADQRQHAVLEIARAFGVDPEDLGVSTTSRTYQNSEQRRQDMIDMTFRAYMTAVEQRLSMRDILPRGYEAKVNLDSFLRSDTLGRMQAYKLGLEVGAYSIDEVRELEDRPPMPKAQQPVPTAPGKPISEGTPLPEAAPTPSAPPAKGA